MVAYLTLQTCAQSLIILVCLICASISTHSIVGSSRRRMAARLATSRRVQAIMELFSAAKPMPGLLVVSIYVPIPVLNK